MNRSRIVFVAVLFIVLATCSAQKAKKVRGVPPELQQLYMFSDFTCRDKSKTISSTRVNDDYCDCADGTDEPGTSACPNGKYYCRNKGHTGLSIFSSKVNDGICDCCDGSDEYEGKVSCANTCAELRAASQKSTREDLEKFKRGLAIKNEYIQKAATDFPAKLQEREAAQKELDELNAQLKAAEEKKRELDEKERKMREEEAQKRLAEEEARKAAEAQQKPQEEQVKPLEEAPAKERTKLANDDLPIASDDDIAEHDEDEDDDDDDDDEDDDDEDEDEDEDHEHKKREQQHVAPPQPDSPELQALVEEANQARNEFHNLDSKKRDLERKIDDINKLEQYDFGPSKEFFPLYGQCFEQTTKEYIYKVCPFGRTEQRSIQGHGTTDLGTFQEWATKFSEMSFTNGLQCWGGPNRSIKVHLECGEQNQLTDTQEPARCEYSARLATPAACNEEHIKVLELELEKAAHDDLDEEEEYYH